MANDIHHPHITPLRTYLGVFAALLVLTAITVTIAQIDFGPWNLVVALLVASVKAVLVAFIFMHLWYDSKLYFIVFAGALAFLTIFIIFRSGCCRYGARLKKTEPGIFISPLDVLIRSE